MVHLLCRSRPRLLRAAWILVPLAGLFVLSTTWLSDARAAQEHEGGPARLPAVRAIGGSMDTLYIGGYARGSFRAAMAVLAPELAPHEQILLGTHLDKVFAAPLDAGGLGHTGRLRLAYERSIRPDGTARSIRVLAAEAAVAGELHTAFYFEHDDRPGYFDPFGRSLDPGAWAKPLESARVTSPFAMKRMHPILRRMLPHTGVDYAAPTGTPVRATADGVIAVAGRRGGYGTMVEIRHPSGYSSRYAHLSALAPGLATGTLVRKGDVVGRVGMSGLATGPHLHYEVRRQGQPIDPARLAEARGVPTDLGGDPGWAPARQRLAQLLSRAPGVQAR